MQQGRDGSYSVKYGTVNEVHALINTILDGEAPSTNHATPDPSQDLSKTTPIKPSQIRPSQTKASQVLTNPAPMRADKVID